MPGEKGRPGARRVPAHPGGPSDAGGAGTAELLRAGWSPAKPAHLPRRTLWPAVAALGIVLLMWGVVTVYMIAAVGVVLVGVATLGWIGELLHER